MANPEHLEILDQGVKIWNEWRKRNPRIQVDLSGTDIFGVNLKGADLRGVDLSGVDFGKDGNRDIVPRDVNLSDADLSNADLSNACFSGVNLENACLRSANLQSAVFRCLYDFCEGEDDPQDPVHANLRGADFTNANLRYARLEDPFLSEANFTSANMFGADLSNLNLTCCVLKGACLTNANLRGVDLNGADLAEMDLRGADLYGAHLCDANMKKAYLSGTSFEAAHVGHADFREAQLNRTIFADIDLSEVLGLDAVVHIGPSVIGVDTIYKSRGRIPDDFLCGVGVPKEFIDIARSIRSGPPIQWYSCFIGYSTKDEGFARRLHSRMREANMRAWFAPEDLKAGKKLHEQLFKAIEENDRLLIVLSEHSIQSEWVMTEIRKAREAEKKEKRRKLFPIRLTDFETLRDWTCFDADTGKDLAVEVREYFIPDFSNWKNHDAFESAFARLKKDLEAEIKLKSV